jgi:hypothetical protein
MTVEALVASTKINTADTKKRIVVTLPLIIANTCFQAENATENATGRVRSQAGSVPPAAEKQGFRRAAFEEKISAKRLTVPVFLGNH